MKQTTEIIGIFTLLPNRRFNRLEANAQQNNPTPINMPDLPEWSEQNVCQVVAKLYEDATRDAALHQQLMNSPYEVLSQRIKIPSDYANNILAKPKGTSGMLLTVPPFAGEASAPATQEAPEYTIVCSLPPW